MITLASNDSYEMAGSNGVLQISFGGLNILSRATSATHIATIDIESISV